MVERNTLSVSLQIKTVVETRYFTLCDLAALYPEATAEDIEAPTVLVLTHKPEDTTEGEKIYTLENLHEIVP
jgi:hypothetical protein